MSLGNMTKFHKINKLLDRRLCETLNMTLRNMVSAGEAPPVQSDANVNESFVEGGHEDIETGSDWLKNTLPSWRSTDELYEQLQKRIYFQDDHMIAINKPVDLPVHHHNDECIKSFLPRLKMITKSAIMENIFTTNRLYSGSMILAKTQKAVDVMTQYFTHCQTNKIFCQKYRMITVNAPDPPECDETIGVELRHPAENIKVTVKLDSPRLPERVKGKKAPPRAAVPIRMKTIRKKELDLSCSVALVEIESPKVKFDALQLYMLHKLAPVLGDHKYSGRIQYILNRPFVKDYTEHDHVNATQVLPEIVCQKLGLKGSQEIRQLPLFLHCSELILPKIFLKKNHLSSRKRTLKCGAPAYFNQALSLLELDHNP